MSRHVNLCLGNLCSLGLVLSAYLGTEDAALQAALGLVYPLYLTGGTSSILSATIWIVRILLDAISIS